MLVLIDLLGQMHSVKSFVTVANTRHNRRREQGFANITSSSLDNPTQIFNFTLPSPLCLILIMINFTLALFNLLH